MTEATRALVTLSAALGLGEATRLEAAISAAGAAADPGAAEEILLQSYLFVGYPRALDALAVWRTQTGRPAPQGAEDDDWQAWRKRGEAVCARVYGRHYERLRANVRRLHPELERWMLTEGYGKVLARPGVALPIRELCVAALLAGSGSLRQLHSHLRGALNVGADVADVDEVVELACGMVPTARAESVEEVWAEVRSRWADTGKG